MKWQGKVVSVLLSAVAMIAPAQSPTQGQGLEQETQMRGYWIDPSTRLMWAGKDNHKDVNWGQAMKYCRNLRLAGYSDWRLATIDEMEGIYDKSANAPGLAGKHDDEPFAWHVKGNLFLTGTQWSGSQIIDEGRPSGYAWLFNFNNGGRIHTPLGYYDFKHALCVRNTGQ